MTTITPSNNKALQLIFHDLKVPPAHLTGAYVIQRGLCPSKGLFWTIDRAYLAIVDGWEGLQWTIERAY